MEKYCIIENFDNYAVSNYGNIKNIKNGRILTPVVNKNGYYAYTFCQNGIRKNLKIHRLVALYFVENPNNYPYVNHKDGNKLNNNINNLEWCTPKYNDNHARKNGLKKQNKPIIAENILTNEVIIFDSISECGSILGINKGTIHKVLTGKRNKTHDYKFSYI